jgi:hypothetical protein
MQTVSLDRRIDADPDPVRDAVADVETFMEAAGFDAVTVDGDSLHNENSVGIFSIGLDLELVDSGALTYQHHDGIFREMTTTYELDPEDGGIRVSATTDFEVAAAFAGPVLNDTVKNRQRKRELCGRFDYLGDRFA